MVFLRETSHVVVYVVCLVSTLTVSETVSVRCVCFSVEILSLLLVSVLWGCTNPLLKRGTDGIEHVTKTNKISQLLAEVKFLFLNLKVNPRSECAGVPVLL